MQVEVTLNEILIQERGGGKKYVIRTVRTVEEIAGELEETEKEHVRDKVEEAVSEAYSEERGTKPARG